MRLKRTKQCAKCPWRKDVDPHDIPNGYSESKHCGLKSTIAKPDDLSAVFSNRLHVMACHEFHCHKTGICDESGDTGGEFKPTPDSLHCAGALIFLEKRNQPHQMMRIVERLGMYDRTKLDMSAPV